MNKYKFYKQIAALLITCSSIISMVSAQQSAFPTAEGCGKFVTGGRGTATTPTTVFEVTKLTDDGSVGTLRYAITATATYRTIVFRVSGTIYLTSALKIAKGNTTIAGQTAPGDGICLADYPVSIAADNVIVRYIRFRMGDKNQNLGMVNGSGNDDSFNGTYRKNIMIDHCTMGWSNDESCTFYGGDSTTLQWNMISEPLNYSYHFETGDTDFEHHGYGGIWGGQHSTFHHNLLAHCQGRVPRFDGSRNLGNKSTAGLENADFRNNVLYNWGGYNTNGGEGGNYNIVNNYYKYGPSTATSSSSGVIIRYEILNPYKQTSPVLPYGKYFVTGNYIDGSPTTTLRNWLGAAMSGGTYADTTSAQASIPFPLLSINTQNPIDAYASVMANVGASLPKRDTLDQRIVNDVINRTGKIIDVQGGYPHGTAYAATVNAWPRLTSLTAPTDTDHDGMPDTWETARGLNPNDASDRNLYKTNGYSNIENYLNGDSIIAAGVSNTCIASKIITAANSGNWLQLSDTASSILISTDTLNLFASIKDDGNYGTFYSSYYVTNTVRFVSGKPYLNRNITITPSSTITTPLTVRFYFTAAEFNTLQAADASIITISDLKVLVATGTSCATTLSGSFTAITPNASGSFGTYQAGYYVEFTTSYFGTFFIGGSITTLPLNLLSFKGSLSNNEVPLLWITSNEINVKNFIVERSADAVNYSMIASITANNAITTNNYTCTDKSPLQGTSFYRLKIINKDGSFTYSGSITISNNGNIGLKIFPNPVASICTVTYPAITDGLLQVVTVDGRIVSSQKITATNGTQTTLNIEKLQAGTYLILLKSNGEKQYVKFVKR